MEVKGIVPAMVTPLDEKREINESALRELTRHLLAGGVHGLFPVGSTGEWYGLTLDQKRKVLEIVLAEAQDQVPVYAGTGAITTRETVEITQMAEAVGVEAVSVLTPVFISPGNKELYNHYKTIAGSVDIPILLYNNPARTGINLEAELVESLSKIDNIIGIKDSSGDMTLTSEYIRRTDPDFNVLAGKDTLIYGTLAYGGQGSITATANIAPQIPVKIYEEYKKGNLDKSLSAQFELAPLRLAFQLGTFPVVMKEGLELIGIEAGPALEPVAGLNKEKKEKLKQILQEMGVIDSD